MWLMGFKDALRRYSTGVPYRPTLEHRGAVAFAVVRAWLAQEDWRPEPPPMAPGGRVSISERCGGALGARDRCAAACHSLSILLHLLADIEGHVVL
jgi:hypothetical protein